MAAYLFYGWFCVVCLRKKNWKIQFAASSFWPPKSGQCKQTCILGLVHNRIPGGHFRRASGCHSRGVTKMGDKADDQDKQVGEIYNLACMFVVQVLFSKDSAHQILFPFLFSIFTLPTITTLSIYAHRSILF